MRAFPLSAPDEGMSIVSADGHELAWIDRLGEGMLPVRDTVLQEGDQLHLVIREEDAARAYEVLAAGPEEQ